MISKMSSVQARYSFGKKAPKEKIARIYEQFFQEEEPSMNYVHFWDEFFLLKPCLSALDAELSKIRTGQLTRRIPLIGILFSRCVDVFEEVGGSGSSNMTRIGASLQTIGGIVDGVSKCINTEFESEVRNEFMKIETKDKIITNFINCGSKLLSSMDSPTSVQRAIINCLLGIMTSMETLSKNLFMEYIVNNNALINSIFFLLGFNETRLNFGHECLLMMAIMLNFNKTHSNSTSIELSLVDDHLILNGYSQGITCGLAEYCNFLHNNSLEESSTGRFHSLSFSSIFGSLFSIFSSSENDNLNSCGENIGLLVAFYEAIHFNRYFMTTLANTSTDVTPENSLNRNVRLGQTPPSNLLATFIEFSSIIMQDIRTKYSSNQAKLCFIIWTCISEDPYAVGLMTDPKFIFRVQLHQVPMRHRKSSSVMTKPMPLICPLIDLMIEFLMTHLKKKLPIEHYMLATGIIHRVLCYHDKFGSHAKCNWKNLWTALFTVLKFLYINESSLLKRIDAFALALQIVKLLNMFLIFGDTILHSEDLYDELYYEIIRCRQTFDNLSSLISRYTSTNGKYKDSATKLSKALTNIRAVITHFSSKIDEFLSSRGINSPAEEQIVDCIKQNYEGLKIEVLPNLNQYETFAETPKYTSFFTSMTTLVIREARQFVSNKSFDFNSIVSEIPNLSGSQLIATNNSHNSSNSNSTSTTPSISL